MEYRAYKGGYDFADVTDAADKVAEELREFLAADEAHRQMEGGDLLFAVVNVLRLCHTDSETALALSTQKFCDRVVKVEKLLAERGSKLTDLSQQQFDQLWEEAKRSEQA